MSSQTTKFSLNKHGSNPFSQAQRDIDSGLCLTAEINDGKLNWNPTDISFWSLIKEDFSTHENDFLSQGFWSLFWHRFGNARMSVKFKPLRMGLTLIYRIMYKVTEWLCGITVSYSVVIGRRVKIEHHGGMILAARAIGNDVVIRQNTTFGVTSIAEIGKLPTIGDGVDIGVGVAILGDVKVGRNARVGANAVVLHDVPENTTVVGVPARPVQIIEIKSAAIQAE